MTPTEPSPARSRRSAITAALAIPFLVLALLPPSAEAQKASGDAALAEAQELLDASRAEEALALLERFVKGNKKNAEGYFLRSTAHFVLGDLEAGEADLLRSLELDPDLRQAWMNVAALRVSQKRYDDAHKAFLEAQRLDPQAPDNDLNLGAVLLLQGQLQAAGARFESHLARSGGSADAYYLVASNYALTGYHAVALRHLEKAIELDERTRMRARTDPNFSALEDDTAFQSLLSTDRYVPPPGAYQASSVFESRYEGGQGRLLGAVIDALRRGSVPFNPLVEVTPDWALIFGQLRVKVSDARGRGQVELSAAADLYSPAQWKQLTERLFRQIQYELAPKVVLPSSASARSQPQ